MKWEDSGYGCTQASGNWWPLKGFVCQVGKPSQKQEEMVCGKQEKMVCGMGNVVLGPGVCRTLVHGVGKGRLGPGLLSLYPIFACSSHSSNMNVK
jgi:hypothetical protein